MVELKGLVQGDVVDKTKIGAYVGCEEVLVCCVRREMTGAYSGETKCLVCMCMGRRKGRMGVLTKKNGVLTITKKNKTSVYGLHLLRS